MSNTDQRERRVRIRRAPKFSVFLVLGAVLGIVVSLALTASFPIDPTVGFGQTFGYFAIYGFVLGILVGSIVALIFDRALRRGSREVPVTVDLLLVPDQEPASEAVDTAQAGGTAASAEGVADGETTNP